jgi:hypothetical protein
MCRGCAEKGSLEEMFEQRLEKVRVSHIEF